MSLKKLALKIAESAHRGQVDKAGEPYINHPLKVASMFEDDVHYIIGILHDVIEDSDITLEELENYGFSAEIITALGDITKHDGEDYHAYFRRVKSNPLALEVKIQDIKHNMDISRIKNPTEKDFERLKKYQYALDFLQN